MREQSTAQTVSGMGINEAVPVSDLRIAVVSDALKDRNGVDAYYRDLVNHLQAHVGEIRYMTPSPEDGELYTRFRFSLPGDATQQVVFPHASSLYKELKILQPHIIVAATNGPFGMFALYSAHKLNARCVVGFHTLIEDLCKMYWGRVLGGVTRGYMECQNWLLFKYADRIVVNSNSMIESAHNLSDTPVTLMGTPLDRRFLSNPVTEPTGSLDKVLYAGRLAPEKNIEAFIECARQHSQLLFTIAGDGPLRDEIAEQASKLENLAFVGRLPRNEIISVIDEHDMLVLPSHLEAFGTVALEAAVRQRLVLVSSHCGILSWKSLAEGLYQFQPGEELSAAVTRVLGLDPQTRREKCERARATALEAHGQAIGDWLDLFGELTRAH